MSNNTDNKRYISDEFVSFLLRNYPEQHKEMIDGDHDYCDLAANIIIALDKKLAEVEGILYEAEAMMDNHTGEPEDMGALS